jgi:hypothetical protein
LKKQVQCSKFKSAGMFEKIGFSAIKYPDIYFHTGTLNKHAKTMIENSKVTIVNSTILKDELESTLSVPTNAIEVILPISDVEKYKKADRKKPFYKEHKIDTKHKIVYFNAIDFKRNGFESFCDIVSKIESTNYKTVITCTIDKELVYAKQVLGNFGLENDVIITDKEIFDIADIYVQPTINKNFSMNVIKAISNKCVAFIPENNFAVEVLDVFAIMDSTTDSNTAYKIDMLLRVPDELKKIRKENFAIGKKLNTSYLQSKLDKIISRLNE